MTIAYLTVVRGNLPALEAGLAGPIFCLGDLLGSALGSNESADRLRKTY